MGQRVGVHIVELIVEKDLQEIINRVQRAFIGGARQEHTVSLGNQPRAGFLEYGVVARYAPALLQQIAAHGNVLTLFAVLNILIPDHRQLRAGSLPEKRLQFRSGKLNIFARLLSNDNSIIAFSVFHKYRG